MMTDKFSDSLNRASALGAIGQATDGPRDDFAASVSQARDDARGLVTRICTLADRLVGGVPDKAGSLSRPVTVGILPSVREDGESISSAVARAHDALTRIEKALP